MSLLPPKETIDYVARFGARCRDCADCNGVCPGSGLPCGEGRKAIKWVVDAINYGVANGFLRTNHPEPSVPFLQLPATKLIQSIASGDYDA